MSEINRLRLVYVFTYSVYGVVIPYLPLVFHELGLNDSALSLSILGIGVAGFLPPALAAHLADRHLPWNKLMSALFVCGAGVSLLWMHITTALEGFLVTVAFFAFLSPAVGLLDAFAMRVFARLDSTPRFHMLRIFGSFGFILPTLALSQIQKSTAIHAKAIVSACSLTCAAAALVALALPTIPPAIKPIILPIRQALTAAWRKPLRYTILGCGLGGASLAMFYVIFPRLLQELGHSTVEIGVITNLGVVIEMILMLNTGYLLKRFGVSVLTHMAIFAIGVRMLILAVTGNSLVIIISQIFHGPIVVGFSVAGVMLISASAEDAYRFSMQSLYTGVMLGISRIFGVLVLAAILALPGHTIVDNLHFASLVAAVLAVLGALVVTLPNYSSFRAGRKDLPQYTSRDM